jgi:hypothetical protein
MSWGTRVRHPRDVVNGGPCSEMRRPWRCQQMKFPLTGAEISADRTCNFPVLSA